MLNEASSNPQIRLEDRYLRDRGTVHLTGIQSLVRLMLEQARVDQTHGLRTAGFVAGYEGSPLGGLDLELQRQGALLADHEIRHQPAVNEELAATAVEGSQLVPGLAGSRFSGVVGYWYGKAPGLDRASDAIRHGNMYGTAPTGGVLAFVGDDPSCKSSTLPSASEQTLMALGVPTLVPADQADILRLGLLGVSLSRATGLWVSLKIVSAVADGSSVLNIGAIRAERESADVIAEPGLNRIPSAMLSGGRRMEMERTAFNERLQAATRFGELHQLNRVTVPGSSPRVGIVACGRTYLDVLQSLERSYGELQSLPIRVLRIGMMWPLSPVLVREFAAGLDDVIVVEEKRPFLEVQIKELLYGQPRCPKVVGKHRPDGSELFPGHGDLTGDIIAERLTQYLRDEHELSPRETINLRETPRPQLPLVARTPFFCSGCPHNRSVQVPAGSLVGAGIGCHGMAQQMNPDRVGEMIGITQMGGEGAQWIGMAPFVSDQHLYQNLGDGTFFHSGSLAIRAAVAADVNITFKLLYNSAVAMTGGQQAVGMKDVPTVARMLAEEGVRKIIITTEDVRRYRHASLPRIATVRRREDLVAAESELAAIAGVTVLIHDQECAAERRRRRKRGLVPDPPQRLVINERICEGCGDCVAKANCLSLHTVETEFGEKTSIHQSSCNKDYTCAEGDCPSFMTVTPDRKRKANLPRQSTPRPSIPEPQRLCPDEVHVRLVGIGGTGVVTTAQILAVAAWISGLSARGLDQTGMSQKAGAVVSDVTLGPELDDVPAQLSAGGCDVYLACDLVAGSDPEYLSVADQNKTRAVVNTARVPTSEMLGRSAVSFPPVDRLIERISAHTMDGSVTALDAEAMSETLFSSDQYANVLLLGVAFQKGLLPLSSAAMEQAIQLNGVAVELNQAAFRAGRQWVADPSSPPTRLPSATRSLQRDARADALCSKLLSSLSVGNDSGLVHTVRLRTSDLVAYQNERYARRYVHALERVYAAEQAASDGSTALTHAVAKNLYKLMAYKDEYEVARLALDPKVAQSVAEEFGPGASIKWQLHPPIFRSLGLNHKVALGAWFTPAFRCLIWARWLRQTPMDPFRYTTVRRKERQLIGQYEDAVDLMLRGLNRDTMGVALQIANLPDIVRGYESVKMRSIGEFERRLQDLRSDFLLKTLSVKH